MAHLNVIGSLFDGHQEGQELGNRYAVESKVDRGFLIALDGNRSLWLHTDDTIANLRRRRCFLHERQQRKLSRRARYALLELGDTRLLEQVLLRHERKL